MSSHLVSLERPQGDHIHLCTILCALVGIAMIVWLPLATPDKALAGEPLWWTQQKAQCGVPAGTAYNDWVAQGSPCNSGGASVPTIGGGGGTPQQQFTTAVGTAIGGAIANSILQSINGNPQADAARQAAAAQAAQAQAAAEQQSRAEVLRQQELVKQRILGSLKDSEPSTDLALKTDDSDPPVQVTKTQGALGNNVVVSTGSVPPAQNELQLKLGDDADVGSTQAGQGFDTAGKIVGSDLPPPPPTPTSAPISSAQKAQMLNVLNSELKKNDAENQSLNEKLAQLQQAPTPDPAAINQVQSQLATNAAANNELTNEISDTQKISVSVDLSDVPASQPASQ